MLNTIRNADRCSKTIKKVSSSVDTGFAHSKDCLAFYRAWLAGLLVAASIGLAPVLNAQLHTRATGSLEQDEAGETALHVAASQGQASEVRRLLRSGADINAKSAKGATPLHLAAANGHLEAVEVLLEARASVNETLVDSGETPLLLAIRNHHSEVALRLLKAGADPSAADRAGVSGLRVVIEQEDFPLASELVERGARVNSTIIADGTTPLHYAASSGNMPITTLLLTRGAAVNAKTSDGNTPLFFSVARKLVSVSTALLQAGADPNIENNAGETPLHAAASEGHAQLVSVLLAYGANVNAKDKANLASPLHFAANSPDNLAVVRWLADHGADLNQQTVGGLTPLHLAAASGDVEVTRFLIARRAKLELTDEQGKTALSLAAAAGNASVVELLADSGAKIDAVDANGSTPLLCAVEHPESQSQKAVELLLAHGANPNAQSKGSLTPLLLAVHHDDEALVRVLVDKGANLELGFNELEVTPFLLAASQGDESIVRFLLARGANLRACTTDGYSALHYAVAGGHAAVARYLIQQGIDVNAQTADHVTALFLASVKGEEALVALLIQSGANVNLRLDVGRTPLTASVDARHIAVAEQLIKAGAQGDFEREPTTAVLVDVVKARSSGNQKRYEQVVVRGGFFSFVLVGMYVDEALARRAQGDDKGGFLEIAQGMANIHAQALGTDELARVVQGYARMTQEECKRRITETAKLLEASGALEKGKLDVAQRLGEQALETFDKSDDQLSRFKAFIHLAQTYYKAGQLEQADVYERKIDLLLNQWGYTRLDRARVILGTPAPNEAQESPGLSDGQRFGYVVADLDSPPDASMAGETAGQRSDHPRRPSVETPQAVRVERANELARRGRDADALREYEALLADKSKAVTDAERANAFLGAARAAHRLRQFGHADFYYGQANRLLLQVGNKQAALAAQVGLADLLSEIGRSREAVDSYSGAIQTAKALGSDAQTSMILSRVGNLFSLDGDQVRAIEYYEEALTLLHKPGSLDEAVLLMNIGTVYARVGRVPEALHYYEHVLSAWKGSNSSLEAKVRVNIALAYHSAGHDSEALKQIEGLNSLDAVKRDQELSWRADRAGALIQQATAHPEIAANGYANAIRQLDDIDARTGDLEQAAKTHILERRRFVYREYLDLLVELAGNHPEGGYEAQALELSEKIKSRIFTDMVARSNAARATPGLANRLLADRSRELELSRLQQQLDAALEQPRGDRDEKKIASLRAQVQRAEQRRETGQPRLGQAQWGTLKSAAELQSFVSNDEVVISYALGIRSVIALVVTKNRPLLVRLPTNPVELEGLIARFRSGLDDVADWQDLERFDPVTAYNLYEKIVKPLRDYLPKGSRINVCGDELLYSVPFEALVDEPVTSKDFALAREKARSGAGDYLSEYGGLHYLIDSYMISYLPSVSVLALMRERQAGETRQWKRPLIAFGDPVFSTEKQAATASDGSRDEGIVLERGDTMQFTSWPEKAVRIADYGSMEDLLGAMFKNSTLSLKRGDKVLVDDIKGKDLFQSFALTPDVEGQFFEKALATATGGQTLERLRDTNDEVQMVAKKTGATAADLFLRDRASKANLYSADLRGTRYLLFATHGFLGGDFSGVAEPALALSQTADPHGYDGFLTMSEVAALDLDAELVVLSACNTAGQGHKADSGEGFAGLTRSFMGAGADSVLVSHWSVDSKAARDVVSAFFDLKSTLPTSEALREAKRSVKRQTRPVGKQADGFKMSQSHPFFWAPFIFVGVERVGTQNSRNDGSEQHACCP
jgi:ankyrin repeat protein/CHAT domain-containing protein